MRLFALAYAGGTASTAYAGFQADLARLADVVPLDLPGRGRGVARRPGSVDWLVDHLWETVSDATRQDWALLGHSYGAGLAFEVARRAEREGCPPRVCFLAGRSAPSGRVRPSRLDVTDEELLARVAEWGALPTEFQAHPALRKMAAARLREDLEFSDELHARRSLPLEQTEVCTLAGREDPVAPPQAVHSWRCLTRGASTAHTFDGGHFFLFTNHCAEVMISDHLRSLVPVSNLKGTP